MRPGGYLHEVSLRWVTRALWKLSTEVEAAMPVPSITRMLLTRIKSASCKSPVFALRKICRLKDTSRTCTASTTARMHQLRHRSPLKSKATSSQTQALFDEMALDNVAQTVHHQIPRLVTLLSGRSRLSWTIDVWIKIRNVLVATSSMI